MDAPCNTIVCSSSVVAKADDSYDPLFEILSRVDLCDLFSCILVSKYWLCVITSPVFRTNYQKNSNSKLVGFWLCNHMDLMRVPPGGSLLPTSRIGLNIARNSMLGSRDFGRFISKSPKGCLVLFLDGKTFYVWRPMCKGAPVELPPPLKDYLRCMATVISSDDDGDDFKVVLAERLENRVIVDDTSRLSIETFCSWTGKWEQSLLTCSTYLDLLTFMHVEGCSLIWGGRVIYWKTKDRIPRPGLAEWVIDGDCITLIPDSPGSLKVYCESPQPLGLLMSASFGWESEDLGCGRGRTMLVQSTIGLYALDDDKKEWDCLYSVTLASIWTKYFGPTEAKPWQDFILVSFVPGKSDSVFLGLDRQLFAYHFPTCKLEFVECIEHDHAFEIPVCYYPLTERDLGIWPCSPTPLHSS